MDMTPTMQHYSSIEAEKNYTSFTWSLKDWSILCNHYSKNVASPTFSVMGTEGCKCRLTFKMSSSIFGSRNNQSAGGSVEYEFMGDIEFRTMQLSVSFVDESMEKLLTASSLIHNSIPTDYPEIRFDREFSTSSMAEYVRKDTLTFFFELVFVKTINESTVNTHVWNAGFTSTTCKELLALLEERYICDVVFEVESERYFAHKVILAAHSDVFKDMFNPKIKQEPETVVRIEDTEPLVFKSFLNYMYIGEVDNVEEVVNKLIVLADRYEVLNLKDICGKFMCTKLNTGNAIKYLIAAHHLCCSFLLQKSAEFIRRNTHVLAVTNEFKMLSDYPALVEFVFAK